MKSKFIDRLIKKLYCRVGWHWYNLPFYINLGKYRFCVYAMNMEWESLRIKIEKNHEIMVVIKKGIY